MSTRNWLSHRFLRKPGTADLRPISRNADSGSPILEGVVFFRVGGGGDERLRLNVDQTLVVQARLRQLKLAFHPKGAYEDDGPLGNGFVAPGFDPVYRGEEHDVKVWPVTQQVGDELPTLVEVLIRTEDGRFRVHPDEIVYLDSRLTHVLIAFLHQSGWGGEDARIQ
jgi:hypothetical protein